MTVAGAGRWISECTACWAMFHDDPEQAGVCPHCGHENHYTDEEVDA